MARKVVAKVVLSTQQKQILTELSTRLGTSESETLRTALIDYAKQLNLLSQILQHKKQDKENTQK